MTCVTPNSRSIGALISPVNAPCSSQCIVCAPKRTRVPRKSSRGRGKRRERRRDDDLDVAGSVADLGRNASRNARVSRRRLVHLPVAGDDRSRARIQVRRLRAASCLRETRASRRRRSRRASSSSAKPSMCAAAAASPPPTTLTAPAAVARAIASPTTCVPCWYAVALVDAHRSVEDDRLRPLDRARVRLRRLRTDVEDHLRRRRRRSGRRALASRRRRRARRPRPIGSCEVDAAFFACARIRRRRLEIVVAQRRADVDARSGKERVRHSAADAKRVDELDQRR